MKIVLLEDEQPAIDKLLQLLDQRAVAYQMLAVLKNLAEARAWFSQSATKPDLILSDIQLPDGLSLQLFNEIRLNIPIIFITAYDSYALDAFRVNGIDYLLKPLNFAELDRSLRKLDQWIGPAKQQDSLQQLQHHWGEKNYKTRFMVKIGEHLRAINSPDILLFYAEGRTIFLYTTEGRRFVVDYTLDQLEELLNPQHFYRINRSHIVALQSIQEVVVYSSSRLRVVTNPAFKEELIVSREKVGAFKQWFGG